jgi:transitional endoplasmic reticulum ATPase
MPLDEDVSIEAIVEFSKGFTGADLKNLCREAAVNAVKRVPGDGVDPIRINKIDFEMGRMRCTPSVTSSMIERYTSWKRTYM